MSNENNPAGKTAQEEKAMSQLLRGYIANTPADQVKAEWDEVVKEFPSGVPVPPSPVEAKTLDEAVKEHCHLYFGMGGPEYAEIKDHWKAAIEWYKSQKQSSVISKDNLDEVVGILSELVRSLSQIWNGTPGLSEYHLKRLNKAKVVVAKYADPNQPRIIQSDIPSEWRDVSTLPEYGRYVLCYSITGIMEVDVCLKLTEKSFIKKYEYWMPLPALPKPPNQ